MHHEVQYEVPSYGAIACFLTNLIWVTSASGFLNFPFVVWHSGFAYLLATIASFALLSVATSLWVLETLARTEGLKRIRSDPGIIDDVSPIYLCEISSKRRYEFSDLARIYFGRLASAVVSLAVILYSFICIWIGLIPIGTALATVIPFDGHLLAQCTSEDFRLAIHPNGLCWNSYTVSIVMVIVAVSLVLPFELGHLEVMQWVMGFIRLGVLITIIAYAFVGTLSTEKSVPWTQFHLTGWLKGISVCMYYFLACQNLPSVVQPLKDKSNMFSIIIATVLTAAIVYSIVGIVVAIRFGSDVNEWAALNWVKLTGKEYSSGVRAMAYIVFLFPGIDTLLTNLVAIALLVNTIESQFFPGRFTLKDRAVCRFAAGILPAICSIYVTNMVNAIKLESIVIIFLCGFYPAAIQLQSRRVWRRTLQEQDIYIGNLDTPYSSFWGHPYCVCASLVCFVLIAVAVIGGMIDF